MPSTADYLNADVGTARKQRKDFQSNLGAARDAAGNAPTMTAATINTAPQQQFRTGQTDLASSLGGVISGTAGPSVAEMQGQRSLAQNIAGQMSMAAGARGPNIALARRTAAMNAGQLGAQSAADSALRRAQETAAAREQLAGVLSSGRGADINLAAGQAGLEQQAGAQNLAANLTSRGQDINEQAGLRSDVLQANQQTLGGDAQALAYEQAQKERKDRIWRDVLNGGLGIATAGLTSDRNLKTDVAPEDGDVMHEFLTAMKPSSFRYKADDKSADRHGVMAQDIEKSRIGKALVHDTPGGKMIDVPQAVGALLAATGFLHGRIGKLELDHKPLSETIGMMGGGR